MNEIKNFKESEPRLDLAKKLYVLVWVLSAVVLGLVFMMRSVKLDLPESVDLSALPALHAFLNTLAACLLIVALVAIKNGRVNLHRRMINLALACSFFFLLSYVCYHFTTEETKYGGQGIDRYFYYFILITHVVLAALSFPFILLSLVYALTNQFQKHKKLNRWVFPVWLYVAITGPLVYLLLRPYY